jgi:phosphoribosylformimino-5-aminoimidazole carboxamide ribotide isomerase
VLVIPAIDLKGGNCVRLVEGRKDSAKVYERDPFEVARSYEQAGARLIHVIDLDGAFLGAASVNREIIRRISSQISVPIEVGGGVRSLADIEALLEYAGARYVIIGTLAVEQPDALREAVSKFGDSIIVSIDARGVEVATRAWTKSAQVNALSLAQQVAAMGVSRIIYTDITRDGLLAGPNYEMTRQIALVSGVRVTASGGVSSLEDIAQLSQLESDGVDSVIVGKALYEGRFTLKQAMEAASKASRGF